jgi:hypothetical protein
VTSAASYPGTGKANPLIWPMNITVLEYATPRAFARKEKCKRKFNDQAENEASVTAYSFSRASRSERSPALNQINDQDNDRNHEQQMDQGTAHVPEKPQKPENEKNNNYGPKHRFYFS